MGYFDLPFWTVLILTVLATAVTLSYRKLTFIDIQIFIMVALIAFAFDMLLCKEFNYYNFASSEHKGWYSFWASLIINPCLGILFVKFMPKNKGALAIYIVTWAVSLTLFELIVAKPFGIVNYAKWHIVPWSPVVYIITFAWIYIYYKWLEDKIT